MRKCRLLNIAVEIDEVVRIEYHITQEPKDLCSMIKRLLPERLKSIRKLIEITEMCKPHRAQNGITEVNAKQEKFSCRKKEKNQVKRRRET